MKVSIFTCDEESHLWRRGCPLNERCLCGQYSRFRHAFDVGAVYFDFFATDIFFSPFRRRRRFSNNGKRRFTGNPYEGKCPKEIANLRITS
jgi:hypothetical protein